MAGVAAHRALPHTPGSPSPGVTWRLSRSHSYRDRMTAVTYGREQRGGEGVKAILNKPKRRKDWEESETMTSSVSVLDGASMLQTRQVL